jgi:hypothetical protein
MSVGLALPDMGGFFKYRRIFGGLMSGRHARPTACIFAKCSSSLSDLSNQDVSQGDKMPWPNFSNEE